MERLKIVALILGSSLLFEACDAVKARIPTPNKRQARAVSHQGSHPKTGRGQARRNRSSPVEDTEYRRLLERARRWKEQQKKKHRIRPASQGSFEIAQATSLE